MCMTVFFICLIESMWNSDLSIKKYISKWFPFFTAFRQFKNVNFRFWWVKNRERQDPGAGRAVMSKAERAHKKKTNKQTNRTGDLLRNILPLFFFLGFRATQCIKFTVGFVCKYRVFSIKRRTPIKRRARINAR